MQKVIVLAFFFFLSSASLKSQNLDKEIETIVGPLVTSISAQVVKNVAIADFTSLDGTPSELGRYIAEEFSYHLVNAKKSFIVIDRSRVAALLKENGLGTSGLVDPNTIAKLGKMKGIDAVIAGTLTSTGNTIRLIVKVWNLETQGLVAAARGDISKTPMISGLEEKQISAPLNPMGSNGSSPKTSQASVISKFTKNHVAFELISCTQSGEMIECKVRVNSKDKDSELGVYESYSTNYSRIFASTGNEFSLAEALLGDVRGAHKNIISNIPIICTFTFSNVTEKVTLIPKMELNSWLDGYGFQMEFRNIPVK